MRRAERSKQPRRFRKVTRYKHDRSDGLRRDRRIERLEVLKMDESDEVNNVCVIRTLNRRVMP